MLYMNVKQQDLLDTGVVSREDLEWATSVRIPYSATGGEWARKHYIEKAVMDAIESGKVERVPQGGRSDIGSVRPFVRGDTTCKKSKKRQIMLYMNVKQQDLLDAGVVSREDLEWASSVRIPYVATGGEWARKHFIEKAVVDAIESGKVHRVPHEVFDIRRGPQIIGDYAAGAGEAIKSMADGKMYDSKSAYRKSLKQHGMIELGNDAPREAKPVETKICDRELRQDIAKAINQLGG